MPFLVRNNEKNATVFSKVGVGTLVWAPAGDPMGGDVQRVPNDLADDVDFLNTLDRGVLSIEHADDPALMAKVTDQSEKFRASREEAAARQAQVLDRRQDRDYTSVPCIGPNPNGRGGDCGAGVLLRAAKVGEEPPLCAGHASLAPEFYLTEDGSKGEGNGTQTKKWTRVTMTAPSRG